MSPGARDHIRGLYAGDKSSAPGVLISHTVRLSAEPPRVSGRTTVRAATDEHGSPYLEIITNYVVVYPFDVPDRGPGSRTALIHQQITWLLYPTDRVRASDRGLWLGAASGYRYNMDCAEATRGVLAPWRAPATPLPRAATPLPTATRDNPDGYYAPDRSLDVPDGCRRYLGGTPTPDTSTQPLAA